MSSRGDTYVRPTMEAVVESYRTYGTHPAGPADIDALHNYATAFQAKAGLAYTATHYSGWAQYELALAKQTADSTAAFRHYLQAEKWMRLEHQTKRSSSQLIIKKNLALIGLLRSRLDDSERIHHLQRYATIGELATLAMTALELGKTVHAKSSEHGRIRGHLSEIVMSGVILCLDTDGDTFIPAPASPRQAAPYTNHGDISGVKDWRKKAYTFSVFRYAGPHAAPEAVIPTQVKSTLTSKTESCRYDPSILLLYADSDLFASTPAEFHNLAQDLYTFSRHQEPSRPLEIARSNVDLAIGTHGQ